ncbi:MAG TPA: energy-coupling factor transporter transmembrane component T [Candidatus Limnocylindrales bacterium]|jgi:energy-coupling factor transport system permease protein|nr:energy-coupling factor transporter transmembrane component T [Candidatus Limnocylindrales bacterium]
MQGVAVPVSMVAGDSFIHRLNPIAKLVWVVGVMVISFATRNPLFLLALTGSGLVLVTIAGIWRPFSRVMLILLPVASSLIVFQSVAPAFPRPWTPITSVGPFTIYQEGIYSGLSLLSRAVSMTVFALVMIMTTHPSDLFASLTRLRVPYVAGFMLTMTLQLIPVLQREIAIVMSAQKSRGMKSTGFAAVVPSFVPVFAGAIERVQQLSISLESRAFGSSGRKTSYRRVAVRPVDWLVGFLGVAFTVGCLAVFITHDFLDISRTLVFPPALAMVLVGTAAVAFIGFVASALWLISRA